MHLAHLGTGKTAKVFNLVGQNYRMVNLLVGVYSEYPGDISASDPRQHGSVVDALNGSCCFQFKIHIE